MGLPSPTQLRAMLSRQIDHYGTRDELIDRFRQSLHGKNAIAAPQSMQYKVVVIHEYNLNAIYNEKEARYRRTPSYKVVPPPSASKADRVASDELEHAINQMVVNVEDASNDAVWSKIVRDVHRFDAGVERIESAPAAFWPELVVGEDGKDALMRLFENEDEYKKRKDQYLKQAGVPIRSVWVPLDRFYPIFEGPTMTEAFELEERSLRSVLSNKMFNTEELKGRYSQGNDGGLGQKVVILRYDNGNDYAYYALGPSSETRNMWPQISSSRTLSMGEPVLLHSYKHGLGYPIYNYVTGRGGGWINASSDMEPIMHALLDLNQQCDELMSQMRTFVRRASWGNLQMKYSPVNREPGQLPKAPTIAEGGILAMWADESLEPIPQQLAEWRVAEWQYNAVKQRMAELAGSASLYGIRQPGVTSGYQEQMQVSQAEHLDAGIEHGIARGAVNRVKIALDHIRQLRNPDTDEYENVYVHYSVADKKTGKDLSKYAAINGKKLSPPPIIEAKVRDPRPVDVISGVQAVLQTTQIRPGHNTPILDDETALDMFLGIEDTSAVDRRRLEQGFRNTLLQGQFITDTLAQRLGLALAKQEQQAISPEMAMGASEAFVGAAGDMMANGEAAMMGGASPDVANATVDAQMARNIPTSGMGGALMGIGGGNPMGEPQPMQTMGRGQQLMEGAMA